MSDVRLCAAWHGGFGDSRTFAGILCGVMSDDALPSFGKLALYGLTLAFPLILYYRLTAYPKPTEKPAPAPQGDKDEKKSTTIMQPERTDLDPPKNDPFTQEQLESYDGTDTSKPVYVAIKGITVCLQ